MAYLLDANTFIEAKNTYYGMDFCPAYWDWLDHANAAGGASQIRPATLTSVVPVVARKEKGGHIDRPTGETPGSCKGSVAWREWPVKPSPDLIDRVHQVPSPP